MLMGWSVD